MKHTQRFRIPDDWKCHTYNHVYFGLVELTIKLSQLLEFEDNKMIEIGSYMGESTHIFGSCGLFTEINCIEPFSGTENFNDKNNHTWEEVWEEYDINTRQFKDIVKLHEDYSYDEKVLSKFNDDEYDFIYVDGNHSFESTRQDFELYIPKIKSNGVLGGHDYQQGFGVDDALEEICDPSNLILFRDSSWLIKKSDLLI
tara:strand:- start:317 stop:910 length:594 start_codon:yes stop_codon:yes gene_type:complete